MITDPLYQAVQKAVEEEGIDPLGQIAIGADTTAQILAALEAARGETVNTDSQAKELEFLKVRVQELEKQKHKLLNSLQLLLEEYESQKSQFGSDYIWQKYESIESVELAQELIANMQG